MLVNVQARQTPKKTTTSKEEIDAAMKQMQQEMNKLDPKTKRMLDSLGVTDGMNQQKKAIEKKVAGISNEALQKENNNNQSSIPKRNAARIAAINPTPTHANLKTLLGKIQTGIAKTIAPATKQQADKAYDYLKTNNTDAGQNGLSAAALWVMGKTQQAVYLMGKICMDDPTNADNLSNYAAMLSMLGAPEAAIPLLNNLHTQYPGNSTILNNLGQAWFGLGDIPKAAAYLDSAIIRFPYHAQANMTKAKIEKSKGNTKKAEEHIKKAIKESYTREKEQALTQLKYKLKDGDMNIAFNYKSDYDPLNLGAIRRPDYPYSTDQLFAYKPLWDDFIKQCNLKITVLKKENDANQKAYSENMKQHVSSAMASYQSGAVNNIAAPLFARKAGLKLDALNEWCQQQLKKLAEKKIIANQKLEAALKRKWPVAEAPCETHKKAWDEYVKECNEMLFPLQEEGLKIHRQYLNEMVYWNQFIQTDEVLQMMVLGAREQWLVLLSASDNVPLLRANYSSGNECASNTVEKGKPGMLTEFDDVACKYNSKLNFKIMVIESNCNILTGKFDIGFLEYSRMEDMNRAEGDTYIGSTIKVSAETEVGSKMKGPLKMEAKAGASVEIEMDKSGVKDVIITVEAKAGAGTDIYDKGLEEHGNIAGKDILDTSLEIGLEGRISIISGAGSISGTGVLNGIKL